MLKYDIILRLTFLEFIREKHLELFLCKFGAILNDIFTISLYIYAKYPK